MKKFLTYLFVFFGFLFVLEVGALAYIWFADPFAIRPLIDTYMALPSTPPPTGTAQEETSSSVNDKNPVLSPAQETALEKVGIDPAKLPTTITPEMQACFVGKLGSARVQEIIGGSTPTATELFSTRACYQ